MKALRIILIILVVIVGGYSIWMATLPSDYAVERSTVIDAEPGAVYATVSDFSTWSEWSKWHQQDPEMEVTFGDIKAGEGASYSWNGEVSGSGTQTITKAVPNEAIETHIDFGDMGESDGHWKFEEVDGKTKVTWGFTGEFPFFFRVFGQGMDEAVGPDFEEGLANLKEMLEAMPKAPAIEIAMVRVEPMNYYGITSDISWDEMNSEFFAKNYGELMGYIAEDSENMTMAPFAIYHKWDEENKRATVEPAVAVTSEKPGNESIVRGTTYGGSCLKAVHVGGYDTEAEHMAINKHIEENGIEIMGSPWEVYVTDPGEEPDTSKWVTEVYYPVVDPADAGEPLEPTEEEG